MHPERRSGAVIAATWLIGLGPAGVAASIRSRMALGSTRVDETSFPRAGDRWEPPDFATAANRVEIEIQGGVGSARVVSQASAG